MLNYVIMLILLRTLSMVSGNPISAHSHMAERKVMVVGKELWEESLPLQMGSRIYPLDGLKPLTWYEVKISYPASIPARFSIELIKGDSNSGVNRNRRLLNTEKLIFKTDDLNDDNKDKWCVLVSVEPEGVVAIPNVPERQHIIFNIVCDELLLGIPHQAWWVVVLAVLCLGLAFTIPYFLPSFLLIRNGRSKFLSENAPKES